MKSTTHKLCEEITEAIGPIFREKPDYETILAAMSLVMARICQAGPKGQELRALEHSQSLQGQALDNFLNEEQVIEESKAKVVERGIDGFAQFGRDSVN
jgi:hypothetical protein